METLSNLLHFPGERSLLKDGMPSSFSPGFVYTFLPLLWVIFLGGLGGRLKKKKKKSSYQHFAIVQKEALTEVPEEAFVV